uniref:RUN domain-containing protein n=1 Tax=Bursaphelenchus xylophilus TaxID=6326 RepID=A0A1I7SVB5_BURXY
MMTPTETTNSDDIFKELGLNTQANICSNEKSISPSNFLNSVLQSDEDSACDVDRWASSSIEDSSSQVLNPIKEKDKLVDQLQTQITDLERFVQFLQQEPRSEDDLSAIRSFESAYKPAPRKSSILSMFGLYNPRHFERNELKKSPVGNHYGDQRAQLELAVDKVIEVMKQRQLLTFDHPEREDMTVEELNQQLFELSDEAVVSVVRKQLAPCLKALLEHGMKKVVENASAFNALNYLGFGCMSRRGKLRRQSSISDGKQLIHVWNIIELYYEVKKAEEREDAAVGQLTQTFNLDSVAGKQATSQQVLLATIENIATSHDKLKRSLDAKWKAFVSAALNSKRLPAWIRIIFRSDFVIYRCYETWSYVCRTGCEDIRPLLEKLHEFMFELPVDLAIRPFQQNRDAF